ncbi:hypothetical protein BDF21DRAFT_414184 [Thamnidium elegans]|nr:hypothetical protein BDF21DRAFT_414184 [Thamnidium elegans]
MNTHLLPLEIIEKITNYLPINDRISCLLSCKVWYSQLYRGIIRVVYITCRRQFTSFLVQLQTYNDLGLEVRELYLKARVNMTHAEFRLIGTHCPLLEVFKFSNWQNYRPYSLAEFTKLKQIPKLYDEEKAYNVLEDVGDSLTHLELSEYLLRILVPKGNHLLILQSTCNLTHLTMDGVFNPNPNQNDIRRMEFDYLDWNLIHEYCPQLVFIQMTHANLKATEAQAKLMHIHTTIKPKVKQLILRSLNLENAAWLYCLGFMYPNLTLLEIVFDIGTFVNFDETANRLDQVDSQTGFLILAHELKKLKWLSLKGLKQTHFPGKLFFDLLLTRGTTLEHVTILYDTDNISSPGMNVNTLNALAQGQKTALKSLDIDMWYGAYEEKFYSVIEPLSLCTQLNRLSLSNDDYATFSYNTIPMDMILDACLQLTELTLKRIAISIQDRHSKNRKHPLKRFDLSLSRVSQPIFDYLTIRCPHISYMTILNCCWMPREIEMKIDMPNNSFEFLRIADMNRRRTAGLEGNLILGHTINLFSVYQSDKVEKKKKRYENSKHIDNERVYSSLDDLFSVSWYHLHEPPLTRYYFPPSFLRKLRRIEVIAMNCLIDYCKQNQHLTKIRPFEEYENRYISKKRWKSDIASGCISITCKSIKTLKYNFNVISYTK